MQKPNLFSATSIILSKHFYNFDSKPFFSFFFILECMKPIFQEIEISAVLVGVFLAKKIVKLLSEDRLLNF